MINIAQTLGALSVCIGILGYIPFIQGLRAGTYVPHPFSWSVFALMTGIAFFAQQTSGAGAGAWITGFSACACILFAAAGFTQSARRYIAPVDWFCLCGALLALVFWFYTSTPLTAVILVTIIDAIAYAPTLRKAYFHPETESLLGGLFSGLKFVPALFALDILSWATALYPASLVLSNALYVIVLQLGTRKRALEKK